jgi:flavin reductase (DIM6/NTAB) family NADH-FMN oxidoreductase RutF
MVTVGDFDNANILTIAWTGILATQPPKTYISVRPSRHSYGILKEKGEFVINLPSVDLVKTTDYVGIYTGAKVDKWEKTGLTKAKSEKVSPPTIAECPIALECRVCEVVPMGSHDVFMADIVSVSCKDEIIDEAGKMRFDRADLLAYAHGEYYSLGEVVGRFGFSTDKPKKEEKKPFYASAPKGKSQKKKPTDKNKGAPHGRRVKK